MSLTQTDAMQRHFTLESARRPTYNQQPRGVPKFDILLMLRNKQKYAIA